VPEQPLHYKRYLLTFFASTILLILVLSAINLSTDQTRVLTGDIEHEYITEKGRTVQANYRYSLMRYLLANKTKYDSLWLGSSRVYDIDIHKMGPTWFRLNFPIGMPEEHLTHLKILINHGLKLKNVVIALDDFSFNHAYPFNNIRYQTYPSSLSETSTNYLYYLLKKPAKHERAILIGKYQLKETGHPIGNDESIANWSEQKEKKFNSPEHNRELLNLSIDKKFFSKRLPHTDKTIKTIKSIKTLCDENNINLTVYINPFHYKSFLAQDVAEKKNYYRKLADQTNFFDFSGLNSVTIDNKNWRELSHFIPPIGDKIINMVKNGSTGIPDFGILVTKSSVEQRLKELEAEIHLSIKSLVSKDSTLLIDRSITPTIKDINFDNQLTYLEND
jgi:hypothetical protein